MGGTGSEGSCGGELNRKEHKEHKEHKENISLCALYVLHVNIKEARPQPNVGLATGPLPQEREKRFPRSGMIQAADLQWFKSSFYFPAVSNTDRTGIVARLGYFS